MEPSHLPPPTPNMRDEGWSPPHSVYLAVDLKRKYSLLMTDISHYQKRNKKI